MKKLFLVLISAALTMNVANANTEKALTLKTVADKDSQTEILMNYANNYEEVTYVDDASQLLAITETAGINETVKYVRLFKAIDENAGDLLAVAVTESGAVLEFNMSTCDPDETNCQCDDPEVESTYGTAIFVGDGCECVGSCNASDPY